MKESRLFKLIYHLLGKGHATASELAEKFEVSVRTIYRDLDVLSEAGIPIYTETGRNGGIYLMKDFTLEKVILSEEEREEILFALQSIQIVQNNCEILQKLSAIFNFHSESWLEIDFSRWGSNYKDNEKFQLLKSAILRRKCVKITYANSYGEIDERVVQPIKILYKSMSWYLKAYCTQKQDNRIFKLTRIIHLEILGDGFSARSFPKSEKEIEKTYRKILLRFDKEVAYRVYDEFDLTQIERQENGDLITFAQMPEDEWLIGYLLTFGTKVDVIEPVYLKKVLAERAKKIYEKNKS